MYVHGWPLGKGAYVTYHADSDEVVHRISASSACLFVMIYYIVAIFVSVLVENAAYSYVRTRHCCEWENIIKSKSQSSSSWGHQVKKIPAYSYVRTLVYKRQSGTFFQTIPCLEVGLMTTLPVGR